VPILVKETPQYTVSLELFIFTVGLGNSRPGASDIIRGPAPYPGL
jgi:hypothetical protein